MQFLVGSKITHILSKWGVWGVLTPNVLCKTPSSTVVLKVFKKDNDEKDDEIYNFQFNLEENGACLTYLIG